MPLALTGWDFHFRPLALTAHFQKVLPDANVAGENIQQDISGSLPAPQGHSRPLQTARSALGVWPVATEGLKVL